MEAHLEFASDAVVVLAAVSRNETDVPGSADLGVEQVGASGPAGWLSWGRRRRLRGRGISCRPSRLACRCGSGRAQCRQVVRRVGRLGATPLPLATTGAKVYTLRQAIRPAAMRRPSVAERLIGRAATRRAHASLE